MQTVSSDLVREYVSSLKENIRSFEENRDIGILVDLKKKLDKLREIYSESPGLIDPYLNEIKGLSERFHKMLEEYWVRICLDYAELDCRLKELQKRRSELRMLMLEFLLREKKSKLVEKVRDYRIKIRKIHRMTPPSVRSPDWHRLYSILERKGILNRAVIFSGARLLKLIRESKIDSKTSDVINSMCSLKVSCIISVEKIEKEERLVFGNDDEYESELYEYIYDEEDYEEGLEYLEWLRREERDEYEWFYEEYGWSSYEQDD